MAQCKTSSKQHTECVHYDLLLTVMFLRPVQCSYKGVAEHTCVLYSIRSCLADKLTLKLYWRLSSSIIWV